MNHTAVRPSLPKLSLFKFPPSPEPATISVPPSWAPLAPLFQISEETYQSLLSVSLPLTFAAIYASTVIAVTHLNKQRNHQPWAISKTRAFHVFTLVHNVVLTVFSAWVLFGVTRAVGRSFVSPRGPDGLAGSVDSLCKLHGTPGLGNAIVFNTTSVAWTSVKNMKSTFKGFSGTPKGTDTGRIWNEGLAFYGWLFYISKYYEVVDTLIILAKGKPSSLLQTYHHAGAIICMWAGIRWMSPPIWSFVTINSFIHTMMYSYFTLTTLGIKVPKQFKQALTTMQIAQFVIGASFATVHLFISYSVPMSVAYNVSKSAVDSASAGYDSVVSAGVGSWLRKFGLRAAGGEGPAENVAVPNEATMRAAANKAKDGIRYVTEYQKIPCIDTPGQAAAIYFNVFYLLALTRLFVEFFMRSYQHRTSAQTPHPTKDNVVEKAAIDAAKGVEREAETLTEQ